jgi:hypothetical protein
MSHMPLAHRNVSGSFVPLVGLALLPLTLFWLPLRHVVESQMTLQMLVEFPVLFGAGWCFQRLGTQQPIMRNTLRVLGFIDWRGWTGAVLAICVAMVWMVPSVLDAALLSSEAAAAKYLSWWLAGWVFAGSWCRMDPEVVLFFAGNLAWMMASAGMLYIDAPSQLCVNFLQDDQRYAGMGLVLLALALGGLCVRRALQANPSDRAVYSSGVS